MTKEVKEGQTYICTTSFNKWWTIGKAYTVTFNTDDELTLVDDEDYGWEIDTLNVFDSCFKLKEEDHMNKIIFKEGQLYKCTRDVDGWFTEGQIYPVVSTENGLVIVDNGGDEWNDYDINDDFYNASYNCLELVTVEHTEDETSYEQDQVETRTITVYYPNKEEMTFTNIVSIDEYVEGEMVLTDLNDDEYVIYLKHALGYSNIIER